MPGRLAQHLSQEPCPHCQSTCVEWKSCHQPGQKELEGRYAAQGQSSSPTRREHVHGGPQTGRGARNAGLGRGEVVLRLVYRWEVEGKDRAGGGEENRGGRGASWRPPPTSQSVCARPTPHPSSPPFQSHPFSERASSLAAGPLGPQITQGLSGPRSSELWMGPTTRLL